MIEAITSSLTRLVCGRPGHQSAQEIGAADDSDDAAITDDRYALYAVFRQDPRNLAEAGLLVD